MEVTIITVICDTYQDVLTHLDAVQDVVGECGEYVNKIFTDGEVYRVETKVILC